jgi:hypothetical protein
MPRHGAPIAAGSRFCCCRRCLLPRIVLARCWVFDKGNRRPLGLVTSQGDLPGRRKGHMRLVLRVFLVESLLPWVLVLAGAVRTGLQIWSFSMDSVAAAFQSRALRMGLGFLIGVPIVVGWPLLFRFVRAQHVYQLWFDVALWWWVLLGGTGAFVALAARVSAVKPPVEGRATECRCGTCMGRAFRVL